MCKFYIILSLNKPNPKAESIERNKPNPKAESIKRISLTLRQKA